MISMDKIWKRLSRRSSIIFICGGLAVVSLRFLPGLIYTNYHKQYLSLSDEDAFALSQRRLSEPCAFGEKSAAAAIQRILADKGYAPAQFAEGERYRTGIEWANAEGGTCKKDLTEARIWYKAAARQNYKPAIKALEKLSNSCTQSSKIHAPQDNKYGDSNVLAKNTDITKYMSTENFESLFGVFFGKEFTSSVTPTINDESGIAYSFSPAKKFLDFEGYGCILTPKSHKVCSVIASKECASELDADKSLKRIVRIIEKRYSATMANLCDKDVAEVLNPLIKPFFNGQPTVGEKDHVYVMIFPVEVSEGTPNNVRVLFARTSFLSSSCVVIIGSDLNALVLKGKEKEQSAVEAL